jgi:hypothetical protein
MLTQTTNRTVVFTRPFVLQGLDGPQPAGTYVVETDEELIEDVSFRALRRVATWIRLPAPVGRPSIVAETAKVDPAELADALARDAAIEGADPSVRTSDNR